MKLEIRLAKFAALLIFVLGVSAMAAHAAPKSRALPAAQDASKASQPLDYEFFKARVEPIFLKHRPGHARCYTCHELGPAPKYLVKLDPGSETWTEEQSRQIFANVSKLINLSDPMNSRFLIHPLSPLAGGDIEFIHTGGRQFESKDDPDWKNMAAWASGAKLTAK
jgi:hypothetical protein